MGISLRILLIDGIYPSPDLRKEQAERNSLPKFREGEKDVSFPKGIGTMLWNF